MGLNRDEIISLNIYYNKIIIVILALVIATGIIYSIKPLINNNRTQDDYKKALLRGYYALLFIIPFVLN